MAVALKEYEVLTQSTQHFCTLELQGQWARGALMVDWHDTKLKQESTQDMEENGSRWVRLATGIDMDAVKGLLKNIVV